VGVWFKRENEVGLTREGGEVKREGKYGLR